MDKQRLAYFNDALNGQLNQILPGVRQGISSLIGTSSCPDPMDVIDITSERSERELMLRMHRRVEDLVLEIQEALGRIRNGSFGICDECGSDIELERLKAHPTATLCLDCKRKLEKFERRKVA
jgi:DnaK suppressor protein